MKASTNFCRNGEFDQRGLDFANVVWVNLGGFRDRNAKRKGQHVGALTGY